MQTDALHNDVTANLIGHQIMVWDNSGCQVQYNEQGNGVFNFAPQWHSSLNSWEEDLKVGISQDEKEVNQLNLIKYLHLIYL